jgi:hypothetical protein
MKSVWRQGQINRNRIASRDEEGVLYSCSLILLCIEIDVEVWTRPWPANLCIAHLIALTTTGQVHTKRIQSYLKLVELHQTYWTAANLNLS